MITFILNVFVFFAARMEVSRSNMYVSFLCISTIYNTNNFKGYIDGTNGR